jgi:hypothetical protein
MAIYLEQANENTPWILLYDFKFRSWLQTVKFLAQTVGSLRGRRIVS